MQHWNLNNVQDRITTITREALSSHHAERDRMWYHRAARYVAKLAHQHGVSWERAAYTVAALSPRVRWDTQCRYMPAVFAHLARGGGWSNMPGPGTLRFKRRAWKCWHGDLEALSGPKVTAFAQNLLLNEEPVTVDAWMQDAATGTEPCTRDYLTPRRIEIIQRAVTRTGRECGIPPSQVQALVWCHVRRGA